MRIKTILFDFGGTLIDQPAFLQAAHGGAVNAMLEFCKNSDRVEVIPQEYEVLRSDVMHDLRHEISPCRYERVSRRLVYSQILTLHGVEATERRINEIFRQMTVAASACSCVFPASRQVLAKLQPCYDLSIVSNGLSEYTRGNLIAQDLAQYFHTIVISEEENLEKPNSELFHRTLARIGTSASEAIMVGNMLYEDVLGAHGAGLRSVWIDSGEPQRLVRCQPDATIRDISELPAAIERLDREDEQT